MSKYRIPRQRERPIRQWAAMRGMFPQFTSLLTRRGGVRWTGTLQPTPDSPVYAVRIEHEPDRTPRVFIDRPKIKPSAPHCFADGSLCLFWPAEWRWRPSESLAATLVPWTALWLYHYEVWQVTGEWCTTSSHNSTPTQKDEDPWPTH